MSNTINVANSIPEAAKALRQFAELTAKNSKNWDNYEQLCLQILNAVRGVKNEQ